MTHEPRLRARSTLALWSRIQRALTRLRPDRALHVRRLNAHLVRDIGLTPADLARHQIDWPSQTGHHPRM